MAQPKNVHCMAVHGFGSCSLKVISLMSTFGWTGCIYEPVGTQVFPHDHRLQRLDSGKDVVSAVRSLQRSGKPSAVAGEFTLEQIQKIQGAGARVLVVQSRGFRSEAEKALRDAADYVIDEDESLIMFTQLRSLLVSMTQREELRRKARRALGPDESRKLVQNSRPSRVWLRLMAAVKQRHAQRDDYAGLFDLVDRIRTEVSCAL